MQSAIWDNLHGIITYCAGSLQSSRRCLLCMQRRRSIQLSVSPANGFYLSDSVDYDAASQLVSRSVFVVQLLLFFGSREGSTCNANVVLVVLAVV